MKSLIAVFMFSAEGRVLINDAWEDDGPFLKRMGGLARLYAAIIQTSVSQGKTHPCGPDRGWRLIADILKLGDCN